MIRKPILQVALDFLNLHRAIQLAKEALAGGADWLEVGTPLIKSEGMNAIREIRKAFPNTTIVADMKTMDLGRVEVEMAAKSGADIVCILGVADDSTISEAVEAAKNYGAQIMVDIINVDNPVKRAIELEKLGVDYICVHVGVDQQMKGVDPLNLLKEIRGKVSIPLAIAGGINSETAAKAVELGANIVIVGGAITKSEDARKATEIIKKAMLEAKPIKTDLYKRFTSPEDIRKILLKVSTPNISDAMHRKGFLKGIKPITGNVKMVGEAVTVRTYPGDWAKPVEAIDVAPPGSVIVIDAGGVGPAVWGELASWSCKLKGISGVVIDGAVRDVDEIRKIHFPVFARLITPNAGEPKGFGEINKPITCGGVLIEPGDWIVGDDNGVVVIPKRKVVEIANRALSVLEMENRIREEIKRGSTLSQVLKLEKWEKVH